MTCEHCLLCYSLTIFLVSWAVACIYLTINSLYGGKEENSTKGHNNNGTDLNNPGAETKSADLLGCNTANVLRSQIHVEVTSNGKEDVLDVLSNKAGI
ncbi:MAG: hypothetical protein ACON5A_05735 [Candidatus Comchoanobacterales bacterium]